VGTTYNDTSAISTDSYTYFVTATNSVGTSVPSSGVNVAPASGGGSVNIPIVLNGSFDGALWYGIPSGPITLPSGAVVTVTIGGTAIAEGSGSGGAIQYQLGTTVLRVNNYTDTSVLPVLSYVP